MAVIPTRSSGAGLCLALALVSSLAGAETFVVTKTDDDNGPCLPDDCALREAVMAANTTPGPDRVELPAGVYPLTIPRVGLEISQATPESGDLDILEELEIAGDPTGRTVIVGNEDYRVVEILFTTSALSDVELTGGTQPDDSGGCVRTLRSNVTFIDSSVTNCFSSAVGGGVAFLRSAGTFINSTVSNNEGFRGGGIYHSGSEVTDDLNIINSTISGNYAPQIGGGLYRVADGNALISHSTFTGNESSAGDVMMLDSTNRATWVRNSILDGKCRGFLPDTQGGNLSGPDPDSHCFPNRPNDTFSENLGLAPLANNGGPTMTHALLPGSPAFDAADPTHCEATDQRGMPRPVGAGCDVGAVEMPEPLFATGVPTLDVWGVLVFALLLAGTAVAVVRRSSWTGSSRRTTTSEPSTEL